jgi:outer membrane receptor protein involved in Fe transport
MASYAWHAATFVDYARLQSDGSTQQLSGNSLELSPEHLGALGIAYAPDNGLEASVVWKHVGARYLNKSNTSTADSYDTIDAGIGFRWRAWEVRLDGYNLTDQRDPVAESELGDAQFYRLPGRTALISVRVDFAG